jgi:hypothetical protein
VRHDLSLSRSLLSLSLYAVVVVQNPSSFALDLIFFFLPACLPAFLPSLAEVETKSLLQPNKIKKNLKNLEIFMILALRFPVPSNTSHHQQQHIIGKTKNKNTSTSFH